MPQRGTGSQAVQKDPWATRGRAKNRLLMGLFRRHFLVDQEARDPRPLVAQLRGFPHFGVEPLRGEIVPPAAAIDEFDEMGLPTLRQGEPFARDTVVRTWLPSRHEKARSASLVNAFGIGASAYSSACLIRAIKLLCLFDGRTY